MQYPVFEAALTGRAILESSDQPELNTTDGTWSRATGLLDIAPQSEAEIDAIRDAVINREGLLMEILDVLRRVPRRVLMVFKLNDLTRSLDAALKTTHSNVRVFLITARYCARAVWIDDRRRIIDQLREDGLMSLGLVWEYFACWWYVFWSTVYNSQRSSLI
jgi:aarF domain-containing kinase